MDANKMSRKDAKERQTNSRFMQMNYRSAPEERHQRAGGNLRPQLDVGYKDVAPTELGVFFLIIVSIKISLLRS